MAVEKPVPKPTTKVQLIPWDPDSPDHVERLFLQRIACGWEEQSVKAKWQDLQRQGHKSIHWIVCIFLQLVAI
jgi:hypothetical protein